MTLWALAGRHIAVQSNPNSEVTVCTGSEWYQFPSHFHLPANAKLGFYNDGFTGILPAHFNAENGTFATPKYNFNDRNREEVDRYLDIKAECDYVVILIDENKPFARQAEVRKDFIVAAEEDVQKEKGEFRKVVGQKVISIEFSPSSLYRAYFVPHKSPQSVKFQEYVLFEKIQ